MTHESSSSVECEEHDHGNVIECIGRERSTATVGGARPVAVVRFAHPDEGGTLRRLTQLDDAAELANEILVATIDADVVAALSLDDGRVVANPFVYTSDAVQLLRRTATALTGRRRRWRSTSRPGFA